MTKRYSLVLIMVLTAIFTLVAGSAMHAAEAWQIRHIATPVKDRVPSFVSADGDKIVWTGASGVTEDSRTYVYDPLTGKNTEIPGPLPGRYYNPCIDGKTVMLQGGRLYANDNVFLFDLESSSFRAISTNEINNWNPRVHNKRVVWEKEGPSAAAGIYLFNLTTSKTTKVLSGGEYHNPDIWSHYVVCLKTVRQDGQISAQVILHDLSTDETKALTDDTHCHKHPRISDGKIVWSRGDAWAENGSTPYPWTSHQIVVYDIASDTTTVLTDNKRVNLDPCIEGDLIAWHTDHPQAIMIHDLSDDTTVQINAQGDAIGAPDIDGTTIVWFGDKGLYTAVSSADATRFADVPKGHPNYTAIENMAAKSIISGYGTGYFGPNDKVIRQQFAKMIVLTMGHVVTSLDVRVPDFKDAHLMRPKAGELYPYHYVAKAALTGLAQGHDDGTFRPANEITRQQVITMAVRAGQGRLQAVPTEWTGWLSYGDPTHGQNIRTAEYNGLLAGVTGPGSSLYGWNTTVNATRAECAQILWNLRVLVNPGG